MELNKYLPSKTFRMRALVVGIVLLSAYLLSLLGTLGGVSYRQIGNATPQTIGDVLSQDTDGDGVPDWEERLWKTDPFQQNSNPEGIDDRTYIEKQRSLLGDATPVEENNQTDLLAQDLSILTTALQVNNTLDETISEKIAESVTTSLQQVIPLSVYSKESLTLSSATTENRRVYAREVERIIRKYTGPYELGRELEILALTLENQEDTLLPELVPIANGYTLFAKELSTLTIPDDISDTHLSLINTLHNLGVATSNFRKIFSDPVAASQSIVQYRSYSELAEEDITTLGLYFKNNGILR